MAETPFLIVDSHLDLAFSGCQINRDLTVPAATVRTHDPEAVSRAFGSCTVTFPELRRGHVGIVLATVMSRLDPNDRWSRTGMYTQAQCYGVGCGHYHYYLGLERLGVARLIRSCQALDEMVEAWADPRPDTPVGLVLAMESADPILGPDQVEEWRQRGLRMVSISHYGTGAYCHGTGTEGGIFPRGRDLLAALRAAGIVVDLTHTTDQAFWEILEIYDGPVAASHHCCRTLVPGQRQLTDEMIRAIAARDGVIGTACDAWMLDPGWQRELPACQQVTAATLETVADHLDHVCQVTGCARHAGIGSDLDGGYGYEQGPRDLNTIADLQALAGIFARRGYGRQDVAAMLGGNWIRLLRETWPT
jgi:membrane dipeptidase